MTHFSASEYEIKMYDVISNKYKLGMVTINDKDKNGKQF